MTEYFEKCAVTLKTWGRALDRNDTVFVLTTLLTLVVWWVVQGRRKYSTKGMR